jgi:hypothetical protein
MNTTIYKAGFVLFLLLLFAGFSVAQPQPPRAIGFNIDLLPTALSASCGTVGGAGQIWYGQDHLRFRAVGAHFRLPNSLIAQDHFRKQETTAIACICDYVTGKNFDGVWIGSGVEVWLNKIGYENTRETATWTNAVFTVGGGYIWKVYRNFYLDPWAAGHLLLNKKDVHLANDTFKPALMSGEVSLKIGWYFNLK